MIKTALILLLCAFAPLREIQSADWPQGPGPNYDFTTEKSNVPTKFSASLGENVAWRTVLPETGQSALTIWKNKAFLTTFKPVNKDTPVGSDIIVSCLSTKNGKILWQRDLPGGYATRMSAPFGDATAPSPITDGKHLWVLNPTGRLACLDLDGKLQWEKEITSVSRTQPILFKNKLILHRQVYTPDENGRFGHENAEGPVEIWTQLQALDAVTGEQVWLSECGANMGCTPLLQHLDDLSPVLVVGRGGGHGPPEKPEGVSMISADTGETLWTLELPGFNATQTFPIVDDHALVFHGGDHLWVDTATGDIARQVSFINEVPVCRWTPEGRATTIESLPDTKGRSITQSSNLRVGDYHYFRAYTANYLGRIHVKTGAVEYLELPLQVLREPGKPEQVLWNAEQGKDQLAALPTNPKSKKPKKRGLTMTSLRFNEVRNSRGHQVMGDDRAQANGWGHTTSPIPTAFGNKLYLPILSGLVFVIQADAKVLDEKAVLAINDLGPLGQSFTRASLTTDGKKIYAHPIKEALAFE